MTLATPLNAPPILHPRKPLPGDVTQTTTTRDQYQMIKTLDIQKAQQQGQRAWRGADGRGGPSEGVHSLRRKGRIEAEARVPHGRLGNPGVAGPDVLKHLVGGHLHNTLLRPYCGAQLLCPFRHGLWQVTRLGTQALLAPMNSNTWWVATCTTHDPLLRSAQPICQLRMCSLASLEPRDHAHTRAMASGPPASHWACCCYVLASPDLAQPLRVHAQLWE